MDIGKIRKILVNRQMGTVDGIRVDSFSASAIVQVYDALSPENQAKFGALPVDKAASVAFRLIRGQSA